MKKKTFSELFKVIEDVIYIVYIISGILDTNIKLPHTIMLLISSKYKLLYFKQHITVSSLLSAMFTNLNFTVLLKYYLVYYIIWTLYKETQT